MKAGGRLSNSNIAWVMSAYIVTCASAEYSTKPQLPHSMTNQDYEHLTVACWTENCIFFYGTSYFYLELFAVFFLYRERERDAAYDCCYQGRIYELQMDTGITGNSHEGRGHVSPQRKIWWFFAYELTRFCAWFSIFSADKVFSHNWLGTFTLLAPPLAVVLIRMEWFYRSGVEDTG